MRFERSGGILLHPTSLPGPYGIGDLGPSAYRFLDALSAAGCRLWQVLPLGPTGYGDSPYQCFSAFAGNPYLISPEILLQEGLLSSDDLRDLPDFPSARVDYGKVIPWKLRLLARAFERLSAFPSFQQAFDAFFEAEKAWLEDYALFMALKEVHGGRPWNEWPEALRLRHPDALNEARRELRMSIRRHAFHQFLFFRQWMALREYAHARGVRIIGDLPLFVAYDSADVWAHPDLFRLDAQGRPIVVAGVPPDVFSATGQRWGNPIYRWEAHQTQEFSWWIERVKMVLRLADFVRIDHFRGLAACWEIPADSPTAERGAWVPAPGAELLHRLHQALGNDLPLIAEDLGVITPDVVELRERFHLPGMKILQFAFSGPDNPFLPHHYPQRCVVYTGTHDNDTAQGWWESAPQAEKDFARRYLATHEPFFAWDLLRAAWASVAIFALAPMQDILGLGGWARMNYPSRPDGNWAWRMEAGAFSDEIVQRLREWNYLYSR